MNTFDPDATEIRPSSKRQRMALLNGLHGPLDQEQKVHTTILNQQNGAAQEQLEETIPLKPPTSLLQPVQSPVHPHPPRPAQLPHRSFWQRLSDRRWRRRVPVLQQLSMVDCGAACLAMILSYYGRTTSVSEVLERCGVGRDGLSALSIVKAARMYGLRVRAIALQENDFRGVTLPAIVHWEFDHFIIVERWSPTYVEVVDPDLGRRRLTAEEFDEGFTGIVLMLEPGEHFDRRTSTSEMTLRTYLVRYLKQAPLVFVQIIAATLLLEFLGLGKYLSSPKWW